jgi:hypothetical protein
MNAECQEGGGAIAGKRIAGSPKGPVRMTAKAGERASRAIASRGTVILAREENHIGHVRGKRYAKQHGNRNRDRAGRGDARDREPAAFSRRELLRKEREKRGTALHVASERRHDEL